MSRRRGDVAVVGGGPAGWAAARALGRAGLDVTIVAPDAPWTPTYGCWADELDAVGLGEVAGARYEPVRAIGHTEHLVGRRYALVDNDALSARLRADSLSAGVRHVDAELEGHRFVGDHHELRGAEELDVRVVVDATGHRPRLVWRREPSGGAAVQAAFGIVARFDRPPVEPGGCVLMDWRPAPGADPSAPTFLYVLDLGDGWFLTEETSLAAAPAMSIGELRRRLDRRLADRGLQIREQRHTEVVHIPMNLPVPAVQPVVGFGAAGGFVHPATGYSLVASLRLAPVLATAVADGIAAGRSSTELATGAWDALWPTERRRARALHTYGLGVLARLDADRTADFFDTFFGLEATTWADYMDPVPSLDRTVAVMRAMFSAAPWRIRSRLMTGDLRWLWRASAVGG